MSIGKPQDPPFDQKPSVQIFLNFIIYNVELIPLLDIYLKSYHFSEHVCMYVCIHLILSLQKVVPWAPVCILEWT